MKLLFIIDILTYGGAPKILCEIASAMKSYGHSVIIYSYASLYSQIEIPTGIVYLSGKPYNKSKMFKHFCKIFDVRRTIKHQKPDIIVSFMPYPSIISILSSIGLRTKVIISERGDPAVYGGFIKRIGHFIIAHASGAVFQTQEARSFYTGAIYDKSVVIPNPVTLKKSQQIPFNERKNEISFVGRFYVSQKRQDVMLKAFNLIYESHPDYKLVFYGDGEDEAMIKEKAQEFPCSKNIIFFGKVDNISDKLSKSKIFVLASDYEGIPNALIEGMCLGLPCVSTDCTPGGARLLIQDGYNGFIVPRGDYKKIAQKCHQIIQEDIRSDIIGRRAQEVYTRFSPDVIYPIWNQYITKVASITGE